MKIHEASSESEDNGGCDWEPIIDNLKFMSDQPSEHISCSTDELPSLYSVKKKLAADAWEAVRKRLRNVCYALPCGQLCIQCLEIEAALWMWYTCILLLRVLDALPYHVR